MWLTYAMAGAGYVASLRLGRPAPPALRVAGVGQLVAGAALVAAGMAEFGTSAQITGTSAGGLRTGGVYRISRNPQYVGLILAAAGGASARRSGPAAGLAAALAAVYRWWVPVEEQALTRTFGQPYRTYLAATPRWLGTPWGGGA
jgi:protein-S-isoprenylcysteine O-methyltransferase Ste14